MARGGGARGGNSGGNRSNENSFSALDNTDRIHEDSNSSFYLGNGDHPGLGLVSNPLTGFEKCRLWGKRQVLGLGTALKILFAFDGHNAPVQPLQLQRNEMIVLLNLLNRLSESVKFVPEEGPLIEKTLEGQIAERSAYKISTWQSIWISVLEFGHAINL